MFWSQESKWNGASDNYKKQIRKNLWPFPKELFRKIYEKPLQKSANKTNKYSKSSHQEAEG